MKKMMAWVLVLALVMSLLPVGVLAEAPGPHSAAQHSCEHCETSVTWTAWDTTTTLPTTSGHYYLTVDVQPAAQVKLTGSADVVLCLNGHSIDGSKLTTSTLYVQDSAKLTISDCTAYLDAEGVLHAGSLKNCVAGGAMSGAIYAKNNCTIRLYDIIITGCKMNKTSNSGEGYGGAVQLRGDKSGDAPTIHVENVLFKGNTSGASAGALSIYGTTTKPVATIKNCTFEGNSAVTGGAAYITKAIVAFEGCTFQGNTAEGGGAVYAVNSTLTMKNCVVKENSSTKDGGGNVRIKTTTATLESCTIENNTAGGNGGSALYIHGGNSKVTLTDCTVKGNKSTGTATTGRTGIYLTNATDKLILTGKTVIAENLIATGGTPVERNILIQNNPNPIDVGGLTNGTQVRIYSNYLVDEKPGFVTAATAPTSWNRNWVVSDYNGMAIDYNTTDGFIFAALVNHIHCECGAASCVNSAHQDVAYADWTDGTTLPTSGNYCLLTDVELTKEISVTGNLNLCLNGHTVKAADNKRHISTPANTTVKITISDCTAHTDADGNYVAGKLTGGVDPSTNTGGGSLYIRAGGTVKLYGGIICDNTCVNRGGAIAMAASSTFEMYGGQISGNTAVTADGKTWKPGGAIYAISGSTIKLAGGTIKNNEGSLGGAVYYNGTGNRTVSGDMLITENTAHNQGGGLYVATSGQLTITGGTISANTATNAGGGIYATGNVTFQDGLITENKSGKDGAGVYASASTLDMTGGKITGNICTGAGGGGVSYGGNSKGTVDGVEISGNQAKSGGGGMIIQNSANVQIKSAAITGNTATNGPGGGIYLYSASLAIEGGTFSGNTATSGGALALSTSANATISGGSFTGNHYTTGVGGISVSTSSTMKLEGKPVIQNNDGANLQLSDGKTLALGTLEAGAQIAVSANLGAFTEPCQDYTQYFTSDSAFLMVEYRDGAMHMVASGNHKHCLCHANEEGCDHTTIEWVGWSSTDSLPASGNYYLTEDVVLKGEMSISGSLNLCLNGHTVTAADNKRHISTPANSSAKIAITDCTAHTDDAGNYVAGKLTGGFDDSNNTGGGSLYIRSGTVKLYDGIFCNNKAYLQGGAITLAPGSAFYMYGGQLSDNHAITAEGGFASAGALAAIGADVYIYGGIFRGNQGNSGGAIYTTNNSTLTVTGGSFIDNVSNNYGGAIFAGKTVATISGGVFTGNSCVSGGGAVAFYTDTQATITGGLFEGNYSKKTGGAVFAYQCELNANGGTLRGNTSLKDGAGIYIREGHLELTGDILISGNTCDGASGGGISFGTDSTGTITGGVLEKNRSSFGAGFIAQNGAKVEVIKTAICNNHATSYGGGIYIYKAELLLRGGNITGNKAEKQFGGGVAAAEKAVVTMTGGTITGNTAPSRGGGGMAFITKSTFTMTGGTVSGNTAKVNAGGIYTSNVTANISGGTISNNVSQKDGAGIYNRTGSLNISGSVVISGNETKGNGGGISYGSESTGTVTGGYIRGNKAGGGAGMIIQNKAKVQIYYVTVTDNTTTGAAAGMYFYNSYVDVYGGYVANNVGGGNGGALMISYSPTNITKLQIENNVAGNGAAAYVNGTKRVTFTDMEIHDNQAVASGGGIYIAKNAGASLRNVKVYNNVAEGEGKYGAGVCLSESAECRMDNCQIYENVSKGYGGGVYAAGSALVVMDNCTIRDNEAVKRGGGMLIRECAELTNCLIIGNKAPEGAGMLIGNYKEIYSVNGWGHRAADVGIFITDCTITGNHASENGGGIYQDMSAYLTIQDTTITGNTAANRGSGMYLMENTLFAGGVTVTDNVSANNGYAVVFADAEFDGQTYINGLFKVQGDIIVRDNEGGDVFLDKMTTVTTTNQGFGPKTYMNITLDEGLLTQRIYGAYNYEGGNLNYVLTYGDRSLTDPEYDPSMVVEPDGGQSQKTAVADVLLYAGIGLVALVAIGGAVLLLRKKKTAASAEKN